VGERVTSEETVLKKRRRSTYCMAQTNDLKSQHGGTPLPQASAALRRRLRSYYTQTAMYKKKPCCITRSQYARRGRPCKGCQ